jgi:replicative DNA helicase
MPDALDFGLPSAPLAERALLGSILSTPQRFGELRGVLDASDFLLTKHRTIWKRAAELFEGGTPIDHSTLATRLSQTGELESVDGLTYLIELDDAAVPLANAESYAAAIVEAATRRRVIVAAQQLIVQAADSTPISVLLDNAKATFNALMPSTAGEFAQPGDVVMASGGLDAYLATFRRRGIAWPWPRLNHNTGGMFPGELTIIAAGTGRGKTDYCFNTVLHCALNNLATAVYSLEMSREQVVNRLAALSGGFNRGCIRHEPLSWQYAGMAAGFGAVADLPIFVRDSSACTIAAIESGIRRLQVKHDIRLVVVDYLQLVTGRGNTRQEEVGSVARGLKVMASTLKVHILAACQFSREHQKAGAKPRLHDLRESGDIEQAANNVLFLHGETTYESQPAEELALDLILAKQRDGAGSMVIPLMFRGDTGRFSEAT